MIKSMRSARTAPLVTVESVRSPRQALTDKRAQCLRRLRLAYDAFSELEELAALLDTERCTDAAGRAARAAHILCDVAQSINAIQGIEQLPTLAVVKRQRRARRDAQPMGTAA